MMLAEFIKLYDRDLQRLQNEIGAFEQEENLWQIAGNVKNSAGNLCQHLVGNLNTYVGKNLGNFDYIRNREAEFSLKDIPKPALVQQVIETRKIVISTLEKLETGVLENRYPENVLGFEMTTGFFLIHLNAHLSYHLGQINYLRRILE